MEFSEPKGLKLVCISDTHSKHNNLSIPSGDVLIHAGDFSNVGKKEETSDFVDWLCSKPHSSKIFIAGNHDITMHEDYYSKNTLSGAERFHSSLFRKPDFNAAEYAQSCKNIVTSSFNRGAHYLEDEMFLLPYSDKNADDDAIPNSGGAEHNIASSGSTEQSGCSPLLSPSPSVSVYGSPWQPEFCDWAFNLPPVGEELKQVWSKIPTETDVLITHGPPYDILDKNEYGDCCGCVHLLHEVKTRIKPRVHIFGHIHETYGR